MAIDTIKSSAVLDGAIATADIADNAVTTAKITDANITTAKVADDAITSAKLDTNIAVGGTLGVTGAASLNGGATVSSGTLNMSSSLLQFAGNISLPNVGSCLFRPAADTIAFGINNGQRVSVNQHGLLFGTDTAAANALDDYEEGTWTGTVTTLGTAPSSTQQGDGFYTKIGRQVTVRFVDNTINMSGSSGEMKITGLPFTARNTSGNAGVGACVLFSINIGSNVKNIAAVVNENQSQVYLYESLDDTNYALITDNSTTNGRIWFTITYDI